MLGWARSRRPVVLAVVLAVVAVARWTVGSRLASDTGRRCDTVDGAVEGGGRRRMEGRAGCADWWWGTGALRSVAVRLVGLGLGLGLARKAAGGRGCFGCGRGCGWIYMPPVARAGRGTVGRERENGKGDWVRRAGRELYKARARGLFLVLPAEVQRRMVCGWKNADAEGAWGVFYNSLVRAAPNWLWPSLGVNYCCRSVAAAT